MANTGTAKISGRITYDPPTWNFDQSANPLWLGDVLEQMPCSARTETEYTLTTDGDTTVDFGALAVSGANLIIVKVAPSCGLSPSSLNPGGVPATPNPIVAKLSSNAGSASPIAIDGFMFLMSQSVVYTALTIARATGVQTTVRIQLFAVGTF